LTDGSSATLPGRLIGQGKLVNGWTSKDVDDNSVPSIFYLDLRGAFEITGQLQVFGAIDNLLDRDPPNIAVSYVNAASLFSTTVRADVHDQLRRSYVGCAREFLRGFEAQDRVHAAWPRRTRLKLRT
jgi:iron complex outermembrane recepter protein